MELFSRRKWRRILAQSLVFDSNWRPLNYESTSLHHFTRGQCYKESSPPTNFLKRANPGLVHSLFLVFSNKHRYNFYNQKMWKMSMCWDWNPQSSEYESPPITTRPRTASNDLLNLLKTPPWLLSWVEYHLLWNTWQMFMQTST